MKKFVKETGKKLATGALAILATLGGSSLGVFAEPGPNSPTATIGGNSVTSDSDVSISDTGSTSGTIPVKGYQTSKVYNYEFHISWGDMKFIFDRGVYDPATDHLTKKVRDSIYGYCEANTPGLEDGSAVPTEIADDENGYGVGRWCGFDGENNRVQIENLGNGDITLNVACTETAANVGSAVDMQVAVQTAETGSESYDKWTFTGDTTLSEEGRTYEARMAYKGEESVSTGAEYMTIARKAGTVATRTLQKAFDLNGSVQTHTNDANEVEFFLNITGTPSADLEYLSTDYPSTDVTTDWEQIGTINLTFTPEEDL